MPRNEIQKLILSEIQGLKADIKDVRQTDIPNLHTKVETFHVKLRELEKHQTWATRIYTVIGGALAVIISKMTGHA